MTTTFRALGTGIQPWAGLPVHGSGNSSGVHRLPTFPAHEVRCWLLYRTCPRTHADIRAYRCAAVLVRGVLRWEAEGFSSNLQEIAAIGALLGQLAAATPAAHFVWRDHPIVAVLPKIAAMSALELVEYFPRSLRDIGCA